MTRNELFQDLNETQKVQRIILVLPVTDEGEYSSSIPYIARLAGVKVGITKKVLGIASCTEVKRTGGPIAFRQERYPKTVRKKFDAVTEPWQEWTIPIKCRDCRFANTGTMTTMFRNKDTVSDCIILKVRKQELSDSE
jgi:hypothetical protein